MVNGLPDEVIDLIIRFTAAIPDLQLTISSPRTTPFLALKIQIRDHLPSELSSNRLRLIQAGKVLDDVSPLSILLKPDRTRSPLPPPPKSAKGKEPMRNDDSGTSTPSGYDGIYIHCSIGDALTSEDLENEAILATSTHHKLLQNTGLQPTIQTQQATTTTPAPRGFDRLLATGFTSSDVATLRASFLTQLSHTHTPQTLPHGDDLRALEDRWLDSSAQDSNTIDGMAIEDDEASALDDMFWGNVFGFFWPLGALVWGVREGGVWTRRRIIAVITGVAINVVFGFARFSSSR
jgi:hypothetical protein